MKSFFTALLLVACCVLVQSAGEAEVAARNEIARIKCLDPKSLTIDDLESAIQGQLPPEQVSDDLKNALKCFVFESGYLKKDGTFTEEAFILPAAKEAFNKCKDITGKTPQDALFLVYRCLRKHQF